MIPLTNEEKETHRKQNRNLVLMIKNFIKSGIILITQEYIKEMPMIFAS